MTDNKLSRQQKIRKIYGVMFGADPMTVGNKATLHYVEFLEEGALRYQEILQAAIDNKKEVTNEQD